MKKLSKIIPSLMLAMMVASSVQAQARRPFPTPMPMPIIMPPPVVIHVPKDMKPIEISKMDINVEVLANIAVTKYDITFHNPNNRVLEGEFDFAMTQGQSVSAFALDINGKMREGVVVEKAKGRQVFEAIVRRGVDPGLIEKTADNHFKARVYPFFANGSRRVQITVEEKLNIDAGNYHYKLPLNFGAEIGSFSLNAAVISQTLKPSVKESPLNNFSFKSWNDSFTASFKGKDYKLNGNLSFAIPVENKEKVFTYTENGETYFFANIPVALKEGKALNPKKVTILWDNSNSAGKGEKQREIELLEEYFKQNKNVSVDFVSFNINLAKAKNFKVKGGNWSALKKEIEDTVYDGGTNLKALEDFKTDADVILLFTDGLDSFGQQFNGKFKTKTFAVNSANGFNSGLLTKVSTASGGAFINLAESSPRQAVNILTKTSYKFMGADYSNSIFKEVYPSVPTIIDGKLNISGIMKKTEGTLTLNYGFDKKELSQKVTIKKGGNNKLAKNIWAQDKLRELALDSEGNKKEIIETSKQYGVVTEFTSLIVLEEIMDYVNNEITPPAELLEQYNKLLSNRRTDKERKQKDVIEAALREFEELKRWYDKDFPKEKRPQTTWAVGRGAGGGMSGMFASKATASFSANADMDMAMPQMAMEMSAAAPGQAMKEEYKMKSAVNKSKADKETEHPSKGASVQIKAWESDASYMKDIKKAAAKDYYKVYLELKKDNEDRPSFFFDMAAFFQQKDDVEHAVLIISNTSEMKVDNPDLLRITAQKLLELDEKDFAVSLFKYITTLREESPQTFRDLAFAQQQNGQYQEALDNYYKIITSDWASGYYGIKTIVFGEMNQLIALHKDKVSTSKIDKRFIYAMPVDVRIVISWSAPDMYIDLHVGDPNGEECSYRHNLTYNGGKMSRDITVGYGPQEFMIKEAVDGDYSTYLNFYGGSTQKLLGPVVTYADIYTFYGTPYQTHTRKLVSLEGVSSKTDLVKVEFKSENKKRTSDSKKQPNKKVVTDDSEDYAEGEITVGELQTTGPVDTFKKFFK
ncbi:tetratricopeptide (TPR) repeat protein [Elusimicrobium posterum]|uniref:VIT domain-containing protein n=1 Tax=Elusimicrobium posterum TaxID=3116653 RepID=UPI003C7311A8